MNSNFLFLVGLAVFLILEVEITFGSYTLEHFIPKEKHNSHSKHIIDSLAKASFLSSTSSKRSSSETSPSVPDPFIYPVDYGADPTGQTDSSFAFRSCISALLKRGVANQNLSDEIINLGGATIDLEGGYYVISSPLIIPIKFGNFRIIGGTIRASNYFPHHSYILQIGNATECSNSQASCNENFALENLMLDCNHNAIGAVLIEATMGASLGPQLFILGFDQAGVTVNGGHEVMIHESW